MNVLITVENVINGFGLESIIRNGFVGVTIHHSSKNEVLQKMDAIKFHVVIIELNNNEYSDYKLVKNILKSNSRIKIFVFIRNKVKRKALRFLSINEIDYILDTHDHNEILRQMIFYLKYDTTKRMSKRLKLSKLSNINNLLSKRELEVALLLIDGRSTSDISGIKKIAMSTVSTYKKRIFEKTKVKSIVEISELFKRQDVQLN